MRPTKQQILDALERLQILAYFPASDGAREELAHMLVAMVDRKDRLDWLVSAMISQVGTWYGPVELRGVYCTRFQPADGIEANCISTAGFTALDIEAENNQGIRGRNEQARIDQAAMKRLLQ